MEEVLFFIFAFLSTIIGTIAGFGSSTILLPFSLLFFDFKTALVLVAFFHLFGNVGRVVFFRHGLDKRLILVFGIPSVILAFIGALLVNYINQNFLKLILGIFLLIFFFTILAKPKINFKPSKKNAIIGGSLSGFFAGLIGTAGVLRGAFLPSFNLRKKPYIATASLIAIGIDLTRIPIYVGSGFLNSNFYYYLPILFLVAFVGSYTGRKIVDKIPQKNFKKFVLIMIAIISLKFIYEGLVF